MKKQTMKASEITSTLDLQEEKGFKLRSKIEQLDSRFGKLEETKSHYLHVFENLRILTKNLVGMNRNLNLRNEKFTLEELFNLAEIDILKIFEATDLFRNFLKSEKDSGSWDSSQIANLKLKISQYEKKCADMASSYDTKIEKVLQEKKIELERLQLENLLLMQETKAKTDLTINTILHEKEKEIELIYEKLKISNQENFNIEKDKKKKIDELNNYYQKLITEKNQEIEGFEQKYNLAKLEEIQTIKANCKAQIDEIVSTNNDFIQLMKSNHEKEIKDLIKFYENKIDDAIKDKNIFIEKLKKEFEGKIKEYRVSLEKAGEAVRLPQLSQKEDFASKEEKENENILNIGTAQVPANLPYFRKLNNAKLNRQEQDYDKKVNEYEDTIKNLKNSFFDEKKGILSFNKQLNDKLAAEKNEMQSYIARLERENAEIKQGSENKTSSYYENRLAEIESEYKERIKNFISDHYLEMEILEQDHKKKIDELLLNLQKAENKGDLIYTQVSIEKNVSQQQSPPLVTSLNPLKTSHQIATEEALAQERAFTEESDKINQKLKDLLDISESEVRKLREQLSLFDKTLDELSRKDREIKELNSKIVSIESEMGHLKSLYEKYLEENKSELNNVKSSLCNKIKHLEDELAKANKNLVEKDLEYKSILTLNYIEKSKFNELCDLLDRKESEIITLKDRNGILTSDLINEQENLKNIKHKYEQTIRSLEDKLTAQETAILQSNRQIIEREEDIKKLIARDHIEKTKYHQLEESLSKKDEQIGHLREKGASRRQAEIARQKQITLRRANRKFRADNNELRRRAKCKQPNSDAE